MDLLKTTLSLGSVLAMLVSILGAVSCLAVGVWECKDTLDGIHADISETKRAQSSTDAKVDDASVQIAGVKNQVSDLSLQMHDAKNEMSRVEKQLDKLQP